MGKQLHPVVVVVVGTAACAGFGYLIAAMLNPRGKTEEFWWWALVGGGVGAVLFTSFQVTHWIYAHNAVVRDYTQGGFLAGMTVGLIFLVIAFLYELTAHGHVPKEHIRGSVHLVGVLGAALGFLLGCFAYLYLKITGKSSERSPEPRVIPGQPPLRKRASKPPPPPGNERTA